MNSGKSPTTPLSLFTPYFPPSGPFSYGFCREPLLGCCCRFFLPRAHGIPRAGGHARAQSSSPPRLAHQKRKKERRHVVLTSASDRDCRRQIENHRLQGGSKTPPPGAPRVAASDGVRLRTHLELRGHRLCARSELAPPTPIPLCVVASARRRRLSPPPHR
jgi:hypothetical protein